MIIITAMLFLFVFTLLIVTNLELHLLENKMSINNYHRALVFEAAEAGLIVAESKIRLKPLALPSLPAIVNYHIQLLSTDSCGKKHYQITSSAYYQHASVTLMSQYDRLLSVSKPTCKKEIVNRRVVWQEIL